MKKTINLGVPIFVMITLLFTACNKIEPPAPVPVHNVPPVADAGKDTFLLLPVSSILLDGSASADEDNNIEKYQWKLISGPSVATIANPDSAKTMVENLLWGTYEFELTVTDKYGLSGIKKVTVRVLDKKNFTIKAGADTTIQLPYNLALLKVTLNNYYDPLLKWEKISGPNSVSIQYGSSEKALVSKLVEGVYQFEISVTDYMDITLKDTMKLTVLPDKNVYTSEKLFENIFWKENFSSYTFTSDDISSILLPQHPIKVYFKTEVNADWQLVPLGNQVPNELDDYYNLHFFINDNRLVVYFHFDPLGGGFGDIVSENLVKIVY